MDEKIEDLYKKYKEINAIINNKTEEKNKVLNSLLKSKAGKLYFSLNNEQKKLFEEIYRDVDFSRYIYLRDDIKEYEKKLDELETIFITHKDFPFKSEETAIYIKDGVDTYNVLTDESTKDLEVSDEIKLFIQNIINDLYGFNDELTADDIPVIKVIYDKLNIEIKDDDSKDSDINGIIEYIILHKVKAIHNWDKKYLTYRDNRRPFIKKLKDSIASTELEIKNSDSGFKYLLLYAIEAAKYEVSLLEGKRVTTILKEIDESNMSESEKDYKKDALVEAYYNLTNIDFRKQSKEYFDNDNDICYATFETANSEINKRLIKMRQG